MNVDPGLGMVIALLFAAGALPAAVIGILRGHPIVAALGLLTAGVACYIAALLPARPDSWWVR